MYQQYWAVRINGADIGCFTSRRSAEAWARVNLAREIEEYEVVAL